MDKLAPLNGNLESVYSLYKNSDLPNVSRADTHPLYTNYATDFQGTLDHILYERNTLEVLEMLEMPSDELVR